MSDLFQSNAARNDDDYSAKDIEVVETRLQNTHDLLDEMADLVVSPQADQIVAAADAT